MRLEKKKRERNGQAKGKRKLESGATEKKSSNIIC